MSTKSMEMEFITKNLWNFEKRMAEAGHSAQFQKSITIWNDEKLNQADKVGSVLEYLNKSQPATRQDFARGYLSAVRSPEQVMTMVGDFARKAGLTEELALNWWWIRVMDMSFTGWNHEGTMITMVRASLAGTGLDVRNTTDFEDRVWGVDAIIFNIATGETVEGLQIKPASYFSGTSESNRKAREEWNPKKFLKFKEATGASVRYVVIDDSLKFGYPVFQNTHMSFKTSNRFQPLKRWK